MFRSSIFNFESLKDFKPRVPAGLLAAIGLVVCMELGVRVLSDSWLLPYYSRLGYRLFMEEVVLPKFKEPRIVVFGTSRAADSFMPTELDKSLGLPEFSTVNLSIFGSRPIDWLLLYKRNRAQLAHSKLVIVAVDEWMYSSTLGNDEQFSIEAPFADRWNFIQPVKEVLPANESAADRVKREAAKLEYMRIKRNRLVLDWVFLSRMKLRFVPLAVAKSLHLGKKRDPVFDQFHMVRSTNAETGKADDEPRNHHERIHNFYKFFDTHPISVRHLEELAELVKADGGRLLILNMPNRRSYQIGVDLLYPAEYAHHLRVTADLAERTGAVFRAVHFPEDMGLQDSDYVDYAHVAKIGAEKCTAWLAELIKREKLE